MMHLPEKELLVGTLEQQAHQRLTREGLAVDRRMPRGPPLGWVDDVALALGAPLRILVEDHGGGGGEGPEQG